VAALSTDATGEETPLQVELAAQTSG
jgi:hypothetical protein